MAIKLANNAIAHLAASLDSTNTTIVLDADEVGSFPSLSAGDWHPMTLIAANGTYEVVRVTGRSGNILTVMRATDGTIASSFIAGSRAEIRMTANVVTTLESEIAAILPAAEAVMDAKDADVAANLTATLTALMDSKDVAQQGNSRQYRYPCTRIGSTWFSPIGYQWST